MSPPITERIQDALPPILASLFSADKDRTVTDYTNNLPKDNPIKNAIESKVNEINESKSKLAEDSHSTIFAKDDPADKYDKYLDIVELAAGTKIDPDYPDDTAYSKAAFGALNDDNKVEVAWMSHEINRSDMSGFDEYMKERISSKINTQIAEKLAFIAIAYQYINRDIGVLEQVHSNQNYTYDSLLKWEEYLDEQLAEKDSLYKKLSELRTTQQRESLFNVTDIKNISKWKSRIEIAFAVLLFVLITIICMKFYSTKIKTFVNDTLVPKSRR
jgi:hypothetical protein